MKTAKFFAVLSFAIIFASVNALYAGNKPTNQPSKENKPAIRYEVTVHLPVLGITMCNLYLVQITDEAGRLVVQPQVYVPGTTKYVFNEGASVQGRARIAKLEVPANIDPMMCMYTLNTKPDVNLGPFKAGNTYSFDLYPVLQQSGAIQDN
jgi:hypothetical protein